MEIKSIVAVHLIRENIQKDSGVVRIESIELEDKDGNFETDYSAGFEFEYHEEEDASYEAMIDAIAKRYGVSTEIIDFED